MSKKRKRDITDVDVDLANVYDSLAHENESIRLKAARRLLTKTFREGNATTEEELNTILRRLFRGLCSSRKAARLGFVVALTEFLSQLPTSNFESSFAPAQIIDILESATEPEGGSRGQEERDYYFGRVFGAGAVIQSGIVVVSQDRAQWKRLLDLLCAVALKKPWLRQECGWTLCQFCASASVDDTLLQPFVEDIISVLNANKLIRTPDGVAIWLTAQKTLPHANLLKHVWKYSHPLAAKDINNLAEVMKNARTQEDDAEHGAQGSTSWSASLHFAWGVVSGFFYEQEILGAAKGAHKGKHSHELVQFSEFWRVVVDGALLGAGGSSERKLWGVLFFAQVVSTSPLHLLQHTLCANTLHTLISAFSAEGRYLHKASQTALHQFEKRIRSEDWTSAPQVPGNCLKSILEASHFADFDSSTKSKVCLTLLEKGDQRHTLAMLREMQEGLQTAADASAAKRKHLVGLEYRLLASCIRQLSTVGDHASQSSATLTKEIIGHGLHRVDKEQQEMQQYVRDRNSAALEQLVKAGSAGRELFSAVLNIPDLQADVTDGAISEVLGNAAKRLRRVEKASKKHSQLEGSEGENNMSTVVEGYKLLFSLVAFDIYNGEQESVEIMQDLLEAPVPGSSSELISTDPLVEILLSFSSRPSKFLRTLTPIIFESIASGISSSGIESLTRVLETKENAQGQQEMFEAADELSDMDVGSADNDSDEENDSDVEILDADEASESDDAGSESDPASGDDSMADGEDDELAAFDAALAAALGTSRADDDGSSADSDSDMDDDEMLALDEKLIEVFRARKQPENNKKKQAKDAKDTIVNFKNRVLDLLEVYVKHQYLNSCTVDLVLPLLRSIRTSQTKQITEHAHKVLKDLCSRCKGQNVPMLPNNNKTAKNAVLQLLQDVHDEACLEASNLHSSAASQASILLVKILVKNGAEISSLTTIYAQTMRRMLTDAKCKVQPSFFTDWNNWCVSARAWTTKLGDLKDGQ